MFRSVTSLFKTYVFQMHLPTCRQMYWKCFCGHHLESVSSMYAHIHDTCAVHLHIERTSLSACSNLSTNVSITRWMLGSRELASFSRDKCLNVTSSTLAVCVYVRMYVYMPECHLQYTCCMHVRMYIYMHECG